jgi:DNA-binding MarR family transcriptional regulator
MFFFFFSPEQAALAKIMQVTDEVLKIREEMPLTVFKTFLGVALWGQNSKEGKPLPMTELAHHIDLPHQTVSRHLRYLGEFERPGVPGLGLVEQVEYPLNRRMKTTRLTAKGRALAKRLGDLAGAPIPKMTEQGGVLTHDDPTERSTMGD